MDISKYFAYIKMISKIWSVFFCFFRNVLCNPISLFTWVPKYPKKGCLFFSHWSGQANRSVNLEASFFFKKLLEKGRGVQVNGKKTYDIPGSSNCENFPPFHQKRLPNGGNFTYLADPGMFFSFKHDIFSTLKSHFKMILSKDNGYTTKIPSDSWRPVSHWESSKKLGIAKTWNYSFFL